MKKLLIGLFVLLPIVGGMAYYFLFMYLPPLPFENVCQPGHKKYTKLCDNVGRRAVSLQTLSGVNDDVDYGPIYGVAWRANGSRVTIPGQNPRYSERNAYYYIIGSDTSDYVYLRLADQVDAKGPKRPRKH